MMRDDPRQQGDANSSRNQPQDGLTILAFKGDLGVEPDLMTGFNKLLTAIYIFFEYIRKNRTVHKKNFLCANTGAIAFTLGGSRDDALNIGALGFGGTAETGGGSSFASGGLVARTGGLSANGVDVLELAFGVAARSAGKVSGARIALLTDFDSGVTADGGNGAGGGAGQRGSLGGRRSGSSGGSSSQRGG